MPVSSRRRCPTLLFSHFPLTPSSQPRSHLCFFPVVILPEYFVHLDEYPDRVLYCKRIKENDPSNCKCQHLAQSLQLCSKQSRKFTTKCKRSAAPIHMDLDTGNEAKHSSVEVSTSILDGGETQEPYVGMEFDSEEVARKYYIDYARRVGFSVRIMQRRRSGIDGRTLARRLGCNKQGFSPNNKGAFGPEKKPRPSAREGCKATILVKMEKSGKWVVTRFVKEHNHSLIVTANGFSTAGDKDRKIEELTRELEHQDQLCAAYREKLFSFMTNVEEQTGELSAKIQVIVENVRKVESNISGTESICT